MPKNGGRGNGKAVNKSAAVRAMLADNPDAPVSEIVASLQLKGIKVTPNLVYLIRSKEARRARKGRRLAAARSNGAASPVDVVIRTKALANEVGGLSKLKQLLEVLTA